MEKRLRQVAQFGKLELSNLFDMCIPFNSHHAGKNWAWIWRSEQRERCLSQIFLCKWQVCVRVFCGWFKTQKYCEIWVWKTRKTLSNCTFCIPWTIRMVMHSKRSTNCNQMARHRLNAFARDIQLDMRPVFTKRQKVWKIWFFNFLAIFCKGCVSRF